MSQIQVCFSAIVCYENLSVLYRIHSARVDVDVRVKFLHGHGISAGLQESS